MSNKPCGKYGWVIVVPMILGLVSYFAFVYWLENHYRLPAGAVPVGGKIRVSIPNGVLWTGALLLYFIALAPTGFYHTDGGRNLIEKVKAKTILGARIRHFLLGLGATGLFLFALRIFNPILFPF